MLRSGWILANNVPTYVQTWGGWIEDEIQSDSVILLITGNPGITNFYMTFLNSLHDLLNIPVWVLSHAGNHIPPSSERMNLPSIRKNPNLYNLTGQIKQKKEFINAYIPTSKNIYLIGHSIGAKICVGLLKEPELSERIKQMHLVCPTLQNIASTPNGKVFQLFLYRISSFLITLAWIFQHLPMIIREAFVYFVALCYTMSLNVESCCVDGLLNLFTAKALKGVFFLANDEMKEVKELDNDIYEVHHDKIMVYFGQNDRWAPLYQYEDLIKKYPSIKSNILEPSISHSFVFRSSKAAAIKLADEIRKNM